MRFDGRAWKSAFLALLLTLPLACRREPATPRDQTTVVTTTDDTTPQEGGTLVRRIDTDLNTLNPVYISSAYEKNVLFYLFDTLLRFDANLNMIPGIAEKWEVSEDGKTFTFFLNPRATFSDGKRVTARDVLFTLSKMSAESPVFSSLFEGIQLQQSAAIDDRTVRVVFDRLQAARLNAFGIPIIAEHFYSAGDFKTAYNDKLLGSGPYKLIRWERGREILLERRPDYVVAARPPIKNVLFKIIGDRTVAWNAMKRGDIDEMEISSDQYLQDRNNAQVWKNIDIRRFYDLSFNFIAWNNRDPILSDKRVRRAMAMCLDRKAIINHVYEGTARLMTGPFTADQWAYNPAVLPIEHNPDEARKIFDSLGWKDTNNDGTLDRGGKPLEIDLLLAASGKTDQAEIFQDSLRRAGVKLNLVKLDNAQLIGRVIQGKFQAASLAMDLDADPDLYSNFHSSQFPPEGSNFVFYSNPEVDGLLVQGRATIDRDERTKIYHRVHEILADEQPYTWTVQESRKWAVSRRVKGVMESQGAGLFLWYPGPLSWWIPKNLRTHETAGK